MEKDGVSKRDAYGLWNPGRCNLRGNSACFAKRPDFKPGMYPFTRGIYPTMYRERVWTMRQYSGFDSAEETNERFRYLLLQGQTGLSVAFDLPTQLGLDADSARAQGEVGKVGVPISTIDDMRTLLEDIPLDKVSTSMTINSTATTLLAMYVAVAEERGVLPELLRGTTQNDILKEYVARNTYIYPPRASLRLCADLIDYCAKQVSKWYPISISGYHIHEAGANAVQELAFTLANARVCEDMPRQGYDCGLFRAAFILFLCMPRWH